MLNRLSTYFYLRPKVVLALLLLPPLLWFLVVYIGSLITMLINSFFYLDGFTGKVVHEFTFKTYAKLLRPDKSTDIFPHHADGCQRDDCMCDHCFSAFLLYGALCFPAHEDIFISGSYIAALVQLCCACVFMETYPRAGRNHLMVCAI